MKPSSNGQPAILVTYWNILQICWLLVHERWMRHRMSYCTFDIQLRGRWEKQKLSPELNAGKTSQCQCCSRTVKDSSRLFCVLSSFLNQSRESVLILVAHRPYPDQAACRVLATPSHLVVCMLIVVICLKITIRVIQVQWFAKPVSPLACSISFKDPLLDTVGQGILQKHWTNLSHQHQLPSDPLFCRFLKSLRSFISGWLKHFLLWQLCNLQPTTFSITHHLYWASKRESELLHWCETSSIHHL